MICSKGKISLRQAMFLFLTITFSPSVRLLPNYAAIYGKQAGWLAPIVTFLIMIPIIYMLHNIYKTYKNAAFTYIMNDICGIFAGKTITILYIIWITILNALYVRYYAERLLSVLLPHVNIAIFIIAMLFTVFVVLRKSMVVLARMNEIILAIIVIVFLFSIAFSLPEIKVNNLLPVSRLDIVPILRSNIGILAIWAYFPFIFLFSDIINNKEKIKRIGMETFTFLVIVTTVVIIAPIGILGASIVEISPIPFYSTVKQIALFDTIERIESFLVSLWIISDFVIVAVFTFMVMDMFKTTFKLTETRPLVSMYLIFLYFLSLYISRSIFELQDFSDIILIPANIIFGIGIPILIFTIGKIRKKI